MHIKRRLVAILVLALAAGCGGESGGRSSADVDTKASADTPQRDARDPQQVVADFLELKRQGKHAEADRLLSPGSRQVIGQHSLLPNLPETVQVSFPQTDFQGTDGAQVVSRWTDGSTSGEALDVTWLLKNQPLGWHIVGMMGPFDLDTGQVVQLDFENPQQMSSFLQYAGIQQSQPPSGSGVSDSAADPESKLSSDGVRTATKPSGGAARTQ